VTDAGEAPPASPVPYVLVVDKRLWDFFSSSARGQPVLSTDDNDFPQKGEDEDNALADSWPTRKRKLREGLATQTV
jgi:hypothetical protein